VNVSGITVSGADTDNYTISTVAATTANITKANLNVGAVGVNKVYDATTAATVTLTDTPLRGDVVNATYGSAAFGDKNVGQGKPVNVSGIGITGADAGNYSVNSSTTTTGDITAAIRPIPNVILDSALLPPAMPPQLTPSVLTPPSAVLDLTLPTGFGGGAGGTDGTSSTTGGTSGVSSTALTIGGAGTAAIAAPDNVVSGTNGTGGTGSADGTGSTSSTDGMGGTSSADGMGSTSRTADAAGADAGGDVTVSLVRPATAQLPGIVSVSVPKQIASLGKGFSFPLPAELIEAASAGSVQVTLMSGKRLPSWLKFVRGTKTLVATAMPAGALPIDVLVRIGTQSWMVQITERSSR
jgi:hypothetical protein